MGNNDNIKRLPDAELEIMKELWAAGEPLTRPQLEQRLARKSWTSTTLLALLARLESKGFVSRQKQGKGYLYAAAVTRQEYLPVESRPQPGGRPGRDPRPLGHGHRRTGRVSGAAAPQGLIWGDNVSPDSGNRGPNTRPSG